MSNELHRFGTAGLPVPPAAPGALGLAGAELRATAAFDVLFLLNLICYPLGTAAT